MRVINYSSNEKYALNGENLAGENNKIYLIVFKLLTLNYVNAMLACPTLLATAALSTQPNYTSLTIPLLICPHYPLLQLLLLRTAN